MSDGADELKPQSSAIRPPPPPPRGGDIGLSPEDGDSGKPLRATITRAAAGEGRFVRKSSGKGQHGHVLLRIEPNARGGGVKIVSETPGNVLPAEFIEAAVKGIEMVLAGGLEIDYPRKGRYVMDDLIVRMTGGSFDLQDSSDLAFKMAGVFAIQNALKEAEPIRLA